MIPAQATDITADWLNEQLGDGVGAITGVRCEHIGEGVGVLGEVARLHLDYATGETGPPTMVAKCQSLYPDNIGLSQMMGFYRREVNFYNELASSVNLRVPKPYVAQVAPDGAPFVLIIEEITDARPIDQLEGANSDDAQALIQTLAALHAPYWHNDALFALDWLPPMNNDLYKAASGLAEANWPQFKVERGPQLPAEMMTACEALTPRYGDMVDWMAELEPMTVAHTDPRGDNILIGGSAGDGTLVLLDYQLMTRHLGAWDVAYFLGQSCRAEDRRAWQDSMLDLYLEALAGHGVTDYAREDLVRHYRYCLMHQAWAQIAVANLDPGNERGRQLLTTMLTRAFDAAHENDGIELLEKF